MPKYSCTMAELDAGMNREAVLLDLPTTDPSLWEIRPKFGVAGGPDVVALTDEGEARAYAVGSRIRQGAYTSALEALWQTQGRGLLQRRDGARMKLTPLGEYDGLVWGYLIARGLVESFCDDQGDGVQLTEKGERAHRAGEEERARLLARCRRAAGVDRVR